MVNIEFNGGSTFKINNVTLVRNFHSYVHGNKLRIVNAYDTRDPLLPYTLFSDISVNGQVYASAVQLAEVLAPVLFSKQGGTGGGIISGSGISTRVVTVPVDWNNEAIPQIVGFINGREFQVKNERILIKTIKIVGDVSTAESIESHFWEFKPGKGNYGQNGQEVFGSDLEYISFVTNSENNIIDLGEIGSIPVEIFVNGSGPYLITSPTILKGARNGIAVNYIYVGGAKLIGSGETQTVSGDYIDVSTLQVFPPSLDFSSKLDKSTYEGTAQDLADAIAGNETRLGEIEGLGLFADMANQKILIKNASGALISELSVAFLNNEGTTFFYNETTKELELSNDQGAVLSSIPVSAFVSNLAKSLALNGSKLSIKDTQGNELSFVTFGISNIQGLQAALDGKEPAFSKNTAFNKNFGVGENDVLRGNHLSVYGYPTSVNKGSADPNDLDINGKFFYSSIAPNMPPEGAGYIESSNVSLFRKQVYHALNFDVIRTRTKTGSGWTPWSGTKQTGASFDLSQQAHPYNVNSPSNASTFTVNSIAGVLAYAVGYIKYTQAELDALTGGYPTVTWASGTTTMFTNNPTLEAGKKYELVVQSPDGTNVEYFFLESF